MSDRLSNGQTDWHNWMRDTMKIDPSDSKAIALVWAVIGRMRADELYSEPQEAPQAEAMDSDDAFFEPKVVGHLVGDFSFKPAKQEPAPGQSAEELIERISKSEYFTGNWSSDLSVAMNEIIEIIEADRATQRQAGREEEREQYKKSVEVDEAYMRTLEKQIDRYAAVVEALKVAKYVIGQYAMKEPVPLQPAIDQIEKALSDLDKAKGGSDYAAD